MRYTKSQREIARLFVTTKQLTAREVAKKLKVSIHGVYKASIAAVREDEENKNRYE